MPMGGPWVQESLRLRQLMLEHYVEVVFVHSDREQLVASLAIRLEPRENEAPLVLAELRTDRPVAGAAEGGATC